MDPMIFDTWIGLARVLIVGTFAYAFLVVLLRFSGKRTLTKLNAFDLVVTVALGSTLATVLLSKSVPLVEGMVALSLLVFLQFAITWLSVRSARVRSMIKSEPTLLAYGGRLLDGPLEEQRVTRDEVLAVLRAKGVTDRQGTAAVVLETDGSFSVLVDAPDEGSPSTLANIAAASNGESGRQGTA